MDCAFCGSQDTKYKVGISKSGKNVGQKWEAYDCNEPKCKNEKGYPNRTWVPRAKPKSPQVIQGQSLPSSDFRLIHEKLDLILKLLGSKKERTEVLHEEIPDIQETEEAPF